MLGISFAEIIVIILAGIILIGPQEMPHVVRGGIKSLRSINKWLSNTKKEIMSNIDLDSFEDIKKDLESELESEKKFIIDEAGNYQEIFDISDIIKERKAKSNE